MCRKSCTITWCYLSFTPLILCFSFWLLSTFSKSGKKWRELRPKKAIKVKSKTYLNKKKKKYNAISCKTNVQTILFILIASFCTYGCFWWWACFGSWKEFPKIRIVQRAISLIFFASLIFWTVCSQCSYFVCSWCMLGLEKRSKKGEYLFDYTPLLLTSEKQTLSYFCF